MTEGLLRLVMHKKEAYAEVQELIQECKEKKKKKLDLAGYPIGSIPREITELTALKKLDLRCIRLKKIPGFIGKLYSLESLSVGAIFPFRCEKGKDILLPQKPGNLLNLRHLSLGYGIVKIPEWVWNLDNLEVLRIYNDNAETVPAAISNLKKLRVLEIMGDEITSLPHEIGELSSLISLNLECPRLKTLPDSFAGLKLLRSFRLTDCNLEVIPDYISGWKELKTFKIDDKSCDDFGDLDIEEKEKKYVWKQH